jgi:hypothetical protein
MVMRRSALALGVAAVLLSALTASAQKDQARKLSDVEKKELPNSVQAVESVIGGQAAPNDLSLAWVGMDVLKALDNKEYVPFTLSVDPAKVSGGQVTIFWRVVAKGAPAADPAKKDDKKDAPAYAYQDIGTIKLSGGDGPARLSRSFSVAAGEYDVYTVVKEVPGKGKGAPKSSVLKQSVTVPDLWNDKLATSTVILLAGEPKRLGSALKPQEQAERPYVLGGVEITPMASAKFAKKDELQTFMFIYNTKTDPAGKPDVNVEYNFYTKQAGGGEKFFNKTNPETLNAQTLAPEFNIAAGHQLQSGLGVPLASFPEGDYRLEIKVNDRLGSASVTREVHFTISGS